MLTDEQQQQYLQQQMQTPQNQMDQIGEDGTPGTNPGQ